MGRKVVIPILIILVGVTWLLNVLEVMPDVDWIWTGGLAAAGILAMTLGGWNKVTAVVGPLLLAASVCSLLRQTGRLPVAYEIPVLVIVLGVLMLVAQLADLPLPEAFREEPEPAQRADEPERTDVGEAPDGQRSLSEER